MKCAGDNHFAPIDLSGPLDDDGKLTLVRYLHSERFLTLA